MQGSVHTHSYSWLQEFNQFVVVLLIFNMSSETVLSTQYSCTSNVKDSRNVPVEISFFQSAFAEVKFPVLKKMLFFAALFFSSVDLIALQDLFIV